MDLAIIWESLPRLLDGAVLTLEITVISLVVGLALAVPLAIMRLSPNPVLWMPVYGYILYFRGTPLLVQLFLVYYGSGQFRPFLDQIGLWVLFREAYFCAVLTLTLNTAAYTAEILRGAIQGVPRGDIEAARALGMSGTRLYRRIVLPKAFRIALPAYTNEVVFLLQATSLISIITLLDLTGVARIIVARSFEPYKLYITAGLIYSGDELLLHPALALHRAPPLRPHARAPGERPRPALTQSPTGASKRKRSERRKYAIRLFGTGLVPERAPVVLVGQDACAGEVKRRAGGCKRRVGYRSKEPVPHLLDVLGRCRGAGHEGHARRGRRRRQDPGAAQLLWGIVGNQRVRDAIDRAGVRLPRRDAGDAGAMGPGCDDLSEEGRRVIARGQHVPPDVITRIGARAVGGEPAAPQVGDGPRARSLADDDVRPIARAFAPGHVIPGRRDELHRRPEHVDEGIAAGLAEEKRGRAPVAVIVVRPGQRVGNA